MSVLPCIDVADADRYAASIHHMPDEIDDAESI